MCVPALWLQGGAVSPCGALVGLSGMVVGGRLGEPTARSRLVRNSRLPLSHEKPAPERGEGADRRMSVVCRQGVEVPALPRACSPDGGVSRAAVGRVRASSGPHCAREWPSMRGRVSRTIRGAPGCPGYTCPWVDREPCSGAHRAQPGGPSSRMESAQVDLAPAPMSLDGGADTLVDSGTPQVGFRWLDYRSMTKNGGQPGCGRWPSRLPFASMRNSGAGGQATRYTTRRSKSSAGPSGRCRPDSLPLGSRAALVFWGAACERFGRARRECVARAR